MPLEYKVFCGSCPDQSCQTRLYFAAHKTTVECSNCGQRHSQNDLRSIFEVTDEEEAITQVLKSIVWDIKLPKKGSETVKVDGLSNYHCKLLSPLFTEYGMDKQENPKLLSELGHGDTANCGRLLSSRAFQISPEHIDIVGYGRDRSGSDQYLRGLLDEIKQHNEGKELLIPIHADGDGHCLVHALSRATTGREIFWHALRDNLVSHLKHNLEKYKDLFRDFHESSDWSSIIEEADPYHVTTDLLNTGLGNIHIFALANVLKRPIVLLDSLTGMSNVADYTGIFVPILSEPSECRGHSPLCIAWSGAGHNHFVPLVGVESRPTPSIPPMLIPNIWGIGEDQGRKYLTYNNDGSLPVATGKPLQRGYLLRLVKAIEKVFLERHKVSAELVSDMYLYIFQRVGFVGLPQDTAIEQTRESVLNERLFRCLLCNALSRLNIEDESLLPGGLYYNVMINSHGSPDPSKIYYFPVEELECRYDADDNRLVPYQFPCAWCKSRKVRMVDEMGHCLYQNADPTRTAAQSPSSCCGYKHYWDGREYENIPKQFDIKITLQGKFIEEKIIWFYDDSDPALNSNVSTIAEDIARKYFGSADSEPVSKIKAAIKSRLRELEVLEKEAKDMRNSALQSDESLKEEYSNAKEKQFVENNEKAKDDDEKKIFEASLKPKPLNMESKGEVNYSKADPSKRTVMKREVDGTVKPPSPPVAQQDLPSVPSTSKVADVIADAVEKEEKKKDIKVKVSTSDGRQETLHISSDMDYTELQKKVEESFSVPPSRQVLKIGFPPRAINPTPENTPLGLRNGDRVTVEIKQPKPELPDFSTSEDPAALIRAMKSVSNLHSLSDLLSSTHDSQPVDSGNIDAALSAVAQMAELTDKSMWDYVVDHPELFIPGGVFYNQFARDIGLTHGRHCVLPMLPGRVFRYNNEDGEDRIELCLEPTGHFPVNPEIVDILDRIGSQSLPEGESVTQTQIMEISEEPADAPTSGTGSEAKGHSPEDVGVTAEETGQSSSESNVERMVRVAPGFETMGTQAASVTTEEASETRQKLLDVLNSKKHSED